MPTLPLQVINLVADLVLFFFVGYYLLKFAKKERDLDEKEKQLKEKEGRIDTEYHLIVDNALTKERKIIEDAIDQAKAIIDKTQFVSQDSREIINKALQEMVVSTQRESNNIGQKFISDYEIFLNELSRSSLGNFQNTAKLFGTDLENQIKEFRATLLPNIEKEIEDYKEQRIKEMDQAVNALVQKVSQKTLNKSIPLEDHNNLVIESLEKAKEEGIFD
jgi:hypothetical protein